MARPRTESPELRRARILSAARAVLLEKGYRDLRMSDVARHARLAAGTLYLHFKDKSDIVVGVFVDLFDQLERRFERLPPSASALDHLRACVQELLMFVEEHEDFFTQGPRPRRALRGTAAWRRLQERFHQHLESIGSLMSDCMKEGSLRQEDPLLAAHLLLGLVRTFTLHRVMTHSAAPLVSRVSKLMDMLQYGLGTHEREVA